MVLEPIFALATLLRRLFRAWRSEEVSEASLVSLSLIASALFLEFVVFLVWRLAVDRLAAVAAALQLVGLMLAVPAVISKLGFTPITRGGARVAVANQVRSVARRWRVLMLSGVAVLCASFGLLELQRVVYLISATGTRLVRSGRHLAPHVWHRGGALAPTLRRSPAGDG